MPALVGFKTASAARDAHQSRGWHEVELVRRVRIKDCNMSALVLPYPLSTNRYWRLWNGRAVPSKEATAYKAQVQARAIDAGIKLIKGSVILNIMLRPKRNKDDTPRARS